MVAYLHTLPPLVQILVVLLGVGAALFAVGLSLALLLGWADSNLESENPLRANVAAVLKIVAMIAFILFWVMTLFGDGYCRFTDGCAAF